MPTGLMFSPEALAPYVQNIAADQAPAQAAPLPQTGMSRGAMLADILGQGADLATTLSMVPQQRFEEANPIGLPTILALKAALMMAPWLTSHFKMARQPANVMGYASGIAGAVPAALNMRTLLTTPKR